MGSMMLFKIIRSGFPQFICLPITSRCHVQACQPRHSMPGSIHECLRLPEFAFSCPYMPDAASRRNFIMFP